MARKNKRLKRAAEALPLPDNTDLVSRIRFVPEEGRIWLDDQRMLLQHASAFGVLRHELIETLGMDRARGLLTRIGYNSGANDAQLARRLRGDDDPIDTIHVGPLLHMLEGIGKVTAVTTNVDEQRGHFHGEYLWHESAEAEEHVRIYGLGTEPACWMQIGYASGFISQFMGKPILFCESECRALGHEHCRIIGRPADEWEDAENDLRFMRADQLTGGLASSSAPNVDLGDKPLKPFDDDRVVGVSAGFNAAIHKVRRVARTGATVIFFGESGVGKEVLAQSLHGISSRSDQPFVAVNCAAIPENLVESELFGVERGAFTGATHSRAGRFERANGGTLFLDEIGILSNTAQGKLLRALQEREIERVGGSKTIKVDVRVVAATNLDLKAAVERGDFREDLFYRLNVFPIRVPALRDRLEDIPVFMNHFLRKYCVRHERKVRGFSARAVDAMLGYHWPGNIRELENMVERGVILAPDDGAIETVHLFSGGEEIPVRQLHLDSSGGLITGSGAETTGLADRRQTDRTLKKVSRILAGVKGDPDSTSLAEIERTLIDCAIRAADGNLAAAARQLGMTRAKLVYRQKLKKATGQ